MAAAVAKADSTGRAAEAGRGAAAVWEEAVAEAAAEVTRAETLVGVRAVGAVLGPEGLAAGRAVGSLVGPLVALVGPVVEAVEAAAARPAVQEARAPPAVAPTRRSSFHSRRRLGRRSCQR